MGTRCTSYLPPIEIVGRNSHRFYIPFPFHLIQAVVNTGKITAWWRSTPVVAYSRMGTVSVIDHVAYSAILKYAVRPRTCGTHYLHPKVIITDDTGQICRICKGSIHPLHGAVKAIRMQRASHNKCSAMATQRVYFPRPLCKKRIAVTVWEWIQSQGEARC